MFDPTIYENLKVVFEGAVYDLDLDGHLTVGDRTATGTTRRGEDEAGERGNRDRQMFLHDPQLSTPLSEPVSAASPRKADTTEECFRASSTGPE